MILQAIFDELRCLSCPGLMHIENNSAPNSDEIAYFRGGSFWISHTGLTLVITEYRTNSNEDLWANTDQEFSMEDQYLIVKLRAAITKIVTNEINQGLGFDDS